MALLLFVTRDLGGWLAADRDHLVEHGIRVVVPSPLEGDPRFEVHRVDLMAPLLAAYAGGRRDGDPFGLKAQYRGLLRHVSAELEQVLTHQHGAVAEAEPETRSGARSVMAWDPNRAAALPQMS